MQGRAWAIHYPLSLFMRESNEVGEGFNIFIRLSVKRSGMVLQEPCPQRHTNTRARVLVSQIPG